VVTWKQVSIKFDGARLSVKPYDVEIAMSENLRFDVDAQEGVQVEIDFHIKGNEKGPFPLNVGDRHARLRGRYALEGCGTIVTLQPDDTGYWKYDVVVREVKTRRDLAAIDPGVLVKGGG